MLYVTKHRFNPYSSEMIRKSDKMHHLLLEKIEI